MTSSKVVSEQNPVDMTHSPDQPASSLSLLTAIPGSSARTIRLAHGIIQVKYTRESFELLHKSFPEYAEELCLVNNSLERKLARYEVETLFRNEVQSIIAHDERTIIEKLFSQFECPLATKFWALRSQDAESYRTIRMTNEHHSGYRWGRDPSSAQFAIDKGVVFLDNGKKTIKVPRVGLLPLAEICFVDVEKWIVEANAEDVGDQERRKVWNGLVTHLYPAYLSKRAKLREPSSHTFASKPKQASLLSNYERLILSTLHNMKWKIHKSLKGLEANRRVSVDGGGLGDVWVADSYSLVPSPS